jgi:hypothetical protein
MTWLRDHFRKSATSDSGERAIAGYRLGIKAGGSIRGVRVIAGPDSCSACRALEGTVYQLDSVPALPVEACRHPDGCRCAYRPVMTYEV